MRYESQIYVRSIPAAPACTNLENRIFTEEVLEIIPIVLRQQGTPISDNHELLQKLRGFWKIGVDHLYNSITLTEFEQVLDLFGINKQLITIVEDPGHDSGRTEMREHGGYNKILSPDCTVILDPYQAVLYVFQALVPGVNWKTEKCPLHENCLKMLKIQILEVLKEMTEVRENHFISLRYIMNKTVTIRKMCEFYYSTTRGTTDIFLVSFSGDDTISEGKYRKTWEFFEISEFRNFFLDLEKSMSSLPVWMARVFIQIGFAEQFFKEEQSENCLRIQQILANCLLFLVPKDRTTVTEQFLNSILNGEPQFSLNLTDLKPKNEPEEQKELIKIQTTVILLFKGTYRMHENGHIRHQLLSKMCSLLM
ncbi:Protein CBG24091 [Caenorhabditis briggsae]|uniref:Protein CBG24091 n=1 Tax=Caenorhabditis briggsae TaxID=6238 RepID=A8WJY7_CAEBR|nr:Protein CBG24091 [Caenorhabditis briggsae]CAP20780.1 Protein CBG24091 [Caenorhabditis briggsae]